MSKSAFPNKRCWVYWIHLKEHTDITTNGYVGITTLGVADRYARHISAARRVHKTGRRSIISHVILKYGSDLIVTTLLEGSQEYCQLIENKLRPSAQIAWNIAPGGSGTRAGMKNTPEHVEKVATANRGRKKAPEVVDAMRQRAVVQFAFDNAWEHPYCNKDVWALCDVLYSHYLQNPKDGRRTVGNKLGIPPDSIMKPLVKIKEGWNPNDDTEWLAFKEQYLLEKELNETTCTT